MATIEEYRKSLMKQRQSLKDRIDAVAAQVGQNTQDIECNAEGIEELAAIIGGDE